MTSFRKSVLLTAALAVAAMLGAPGLARADLEIALQEDAGARTVVATGASFTTAAFNGVFGDFTVSILGGASHNAATLSDLLGSTTNIANNSGATHTLKIFITQDGYTLPVGPQLKVESGLAITSNIAGVTLTNIFQAFADKNNNLFGTSDFTNGPQTAIANGSTADTGSANGVFTRNATPYSVTSVSSFQVTGGSSTNFSNHVNLTAAGVPAPAGLVLAASGVPVLALGWLRRRKVQA